MRVTVREGEARCENKRMEKKEPICIILIRAGIIFFFFRSQLQCTAIDSCAL